MDEFDQVLLLERTLVAAGEASMQAHEDLSELREQGREGGFVRAACPRPPTPGSPRE